MILVFTPNWIQDLETRYDGRPSYQQPFLFRLARGPELAEERERIEWWVSSLPVEKQPGVIARLRDPSHFHPTYNELLVGHFLRHCGHQPDYERPLGEKKPDWYVSPMKGVPRFVVEVATVYAPKQAQTEKRLWDELQSRLEQIEHCFHLSLNAAPGISLAGKDLRSIVRIVQARLDTLDPEATQPEEVTFEDGDFCVRFTLIPRGTKTRAPIGAAMPVLVQWLSSDRLRKSITRKLHKYPKAKELGIRLVIALAATPDSGFGGDELLDALFGQEQLTVYFDSDTMVGTEMGRDSKGVVAPRLREGKRVVFNRRLSAVIWITQRFSQPARMNVIHNPYANLPLPREAFTGFPNLVVVEQDARSLGLDWVTP